MKMVKSLLLGSAAGILAVAGAQAADLPVKAKPVEYVKVCSLYGAGFYYIPGTDTCLKLGGFVRAEMAFGQAGGSHSQMYQNSATRSQDDMRTRARWMLSLDARTQTEYGTLRSYVRAGTQYTTNDQSATGSVDNKDGMIYVERAFIQLGGWTAGKTASFYDFMQSNPLGYSGSILGASDTGQGVNLAAYTFTFGNGLTGTISAEDAYYRRIPGIVNAGNGTAWLAAAGTGTASRTGYGGNQAPDVVGNLRVDQAWGSAQLMAAAHQVRAAYYNNANEASGSPDDKWGFAVGGAVAINLPWAAGDRFIAQVSYSQGANYYQYVDVAQEAAIYNGSSLFEGINADAVYTNGSSLELTKVLGLYAGVEHYWTPKVRSSVYGSYMNMDYNGNASAYICANPIYRTGGTATGALQANCNPDWHMYQIGTRTVWSPVANLELGVELLYSKFETDMGSDVLRYNTTANGSKLAGAYGMSSQDVFSGFVRVQRNFWP
jgi:hypothetical protein